MDFTIVNDDNFFEKIKLVLSQIFLKCNDKIQWSFEPIHFYIPSYLKIQLAEQMMFVRKLQQQVDMIGEQLSFYMISLTILVIFVFIFNFYKFCSVFLFLFCKKIINFIYEKNLKIFLQISQFWINNGKKLINLFLNKDFYTKIDFYKKQGTLFFWFFKKTNKY